MRASVFFWVLLFLALPRQSRAVDWGIYAGSHLGFGHEGDGPATATNFQNQSIGSLDLQAMPGVRVNDKKILIGLMLDLHLMTILNGANSNCSFSGTGLSMGPGAEFDFLPPVKFLFSWDWRDRQGTNTPDGTLEGSGFHFILGYEFQPSLWLDLEYVIFRYNVFSTAAGNLNLPAGAISQDTWGGGISVSF